MPDNYTVVAYKANFVFDILATRFSIICNSVMNPYHWRLSFEIQILPLLYVRLPVVAEVLLQQEVYKVGLNLCCWKKQFKI